MLVKNNRTCSLAKLRVEVRFKQDETHREVETVQLQIEPLPLKAKVARVVGGSPKLWQVERSECGAKL